MTQKHIVIDARGRQSSSGRYVDRLLEHLQYTDTINRYTVLLKAADPWKPHSNNFVATVCEFKQFSFNPLDQWTFARYLKKLEPDLVHFWMTPQEPVMYRGVRVTTTHDLTMLRFARPGKYPRILHEIRMAAYRWLLAKSLRLADAIITPTEFAKQEITDKYGNKIGNKITVTHEASEPPLKTAAKQLKSAKKPFIFAVGSAFPHKNLENLIKSFEIVKTSQPELMLVLAGKKEHYYEQLEEFAKDSPFRSSIIFAGFVSDAELKWLYQNATAYVFPSLSEGFGLPGLEAMAHGCPVISSNATCLPEVNGDAAIYFDPEDINDMADKIIEVVSDKKLQADLVKKGTEQLKKFSWQKMAQQTLDVYNSVLEK